MTLEEGFYLKVQKRGEIPVHGGTSARDWRAFSIVGATIDFNARTITIDGDANAKYLLLGQDAALPNSKSVNASDAQALGAIVKFLSAGGGGFTLQDDTGQIIFTVAANTSYYEIYDADSFNFDWEAINNILWTFRSKNGSFGWTLDGETGISASWLSGSGPVAFDLNATTGCQFTLSGSTLTVKLTGLPTSDPHVLDKVYVDSGVLMKSAG